MDKYFINVTVDFNLKRNSETRSDTTNSLDDIIFERLESRYF